MAHSRAEGRQCEQLAHGREVKVSTFAHVTATLSSKFEMTAYSSSFPSFSDSNRSCRLSDWGHRSGGAAAEEMEKAQVERTEDRARERAKLYHRPKGGRKGGGKEGPLPSHLPPLYRNCADRLTSGGGRDGWGNMLIKKFN